jgi:hypothetical protein
MGIEGAARLVLLVALVKIILVVLIPFSNVVLALMVTFICATLVKPVKVKRGAA